MAFPLARKDRSSTIHLLRHIRPQGILGELGALAQWITEQGLPAISVTFTDPVPEHRRVLADPQAVAAQLADHLWDRGYRRFALLFHLKTIPVSVERHTVYPRYAMLKQILQQRGGRVFSHRMNLRGDTETLIASMAEWLPNIKCPWRWLPKPMNWQVGPYWRPSE